MKLIIEKKEIEYKKQTEYEEVKKLFLFRFDFVSWMGEISPLVALIIFCHDKLSLVCLKELKKRKEN